MLLCPECRAPYVVGATLCSCGWQEENWENILVFLSSVRRDRAFTEYLENYDQIASDDLAQSILNERYIGHQAANIMDMLQDVISGAQVCDLGVGKGYLSRLAIERGAGSVTAVDIATDYLTRLKGTGIRLVQADAENLPFLEEFDIIMCTDVLEHVFNPGSLLFCINQALKPGGRFIVRVPFRENLLNYSPHLGCKYRFVHLRSFNKKLLKDMLTAAGFAVETVRYDGFWLSRPADFWMRGPLRQKLYLGLQSYLHQKLTSPVDVTRWPAWVARLLMPAQEIVIRARKEIHLNRK